MLEQLGSIEEVKGANAEPEQFLHDLAKASAPAAKKLAILRLKPKLEPYLKDQGLEWADVVLVLELCSTDELEDAKGNPEHFLDDLLEGKKLMTKKLAIVHLKPKLEPHLKKQGLEWADVAPMLEQLCSIEEVQGAIPDPVQLLRKLAKASAPAAKQLAIMRLKPKLELYLKKQGLDWSAVMPVLQELDSTGELGCAIAHQELLQREQLLRDLATASVLAAKKLAIVHLKPKLEPYLKKQGLAWADVVPMLEQLDSIEEVEGAVAGSEQLLCDLAKASAPAAKKAAIMKKHIKFCTFPFRWVKKMLAMVRLKRKLGPYLTKQGLDWREVVPVLKKLGSLDELQNAVCNLERLLKLQSYITNQSPQRADVVPELGTTIYQKLLLKRYLSNTQRSRFAWDDIAAVLFRKKGQNTTKRAKALPNMAIKTFRNVAQVVRFSLVAVVACLKLFYFVLPKLVKLPFVITYSIYRYLSAARFTDGTTAGRFTTRLKNGTTAEFWLPYDLAGALASPNRMHLGWQKLAIVNIFCRWSAKVLLVSGIVHFLLVNVFVQGWFCMDISYLDTLRGFLFEW
jgi:hypothetical protein